MKGHPPSIQQRTILYLSNTSHNLGQSICIDSQSAAKFLIRKARDISGTCLTRPLSCKQISYPLLLFYPKKMWRTLNILNLLGNLVRLPLLLFLKTSKANYTCYSFYCPLPLSHSLMNCFYCIIN